MQAEHWLTPEEEKWLMAIGGAKAAKLPRPKVPASCRLSLARKNLLILTERGTRVTREGEREVSRRRARLPVAAPDADTR